jgi:hypothetical protein
LAHKLSFREADEANRAFMLGRCGLDCYALECLFCLYLKQTTWFSGALNTINSIAN